MMLHSATPIRPSLLISVLNSAYQFLTIESLNCQQNLPQYSSDNLVCPPDLCGGLFLVAAIDNIDRNLSSSTAAASFHGTAISIVQFPTVDNAGVDRSLHMGRWP